MMAWLVLVLTLIGAYLLGSINGAVVVSKLSGMDDVRKHGSGNAGMTNMLRVRGFVPGLLTFFVDTLKGTVACLLAKFLILPYVFEQLPYELLFPQYAVYIYGIVCLAGHIFPVFFGFKGGKGVATTLGVGLVCCWQTAVVGLSLFIIIFVFSRVISLSSVLTAAALPFLSWFFVSLKTNGDSRAIIIEVILVSIMTLNILISHRSNIVRLVRGEEKKLTVKKKSRE